MKHLAIIPLLFVLAACASSQEIVSRQNSADHNECVGFWFEPGVEDYGNCRLELCSIRAQEDLARSQTFYTPSPWWWHSPYYDPFYDPYWP